MFKNYSWPYFSLQAAAFPQVFLLVSSALYLSWVMLCWVTTPVVICEASFNVLICGIIPTAVIAVCKFILSTVWSFQPCRRATLSLQIAKAWGFIFSFLFSIVELVIRSSLSPQIWGWCFAVEWIWGQSCMNMLFQVPEKVFFSWEIRTYWRLVI